MGRARRGSKATLYPAVSIRPTCLARSSSVLHEGLQNFMTSALADIDEKEVRKPPARRKNVGSCGYRVSGYKVES